MQINQKLLPFASLLCLSLVVSLGASGQIKRDDGGEIEDAEIIIEKNRKLELPEMAKPVERLPYPVRPAEPVPQKYTYQDFRTQLPDIDSKVRVLTMKPDELQKLYGAHLRGGLGNLGTSYFEGFYNSKRSRDFAGGLHFRHFNTSQGPVSNIPSGSGSQFASAYSTYFNPKFTLNGELSYLRERYNFFGYKVDRKLSEDSVKQLFNTIRFQANIKSADTSATMQWWGGIGFTNFADNYKAKEQDLILQGGTSYRIDRHLMFKADVFGAINKRTDSTSQGRNLFSLRPGIAYVKGPMRVYAGLRAVQENDTVSNTPRFHLYPDITLDYQIVPGQFAAFAGIQGDMQRTTLYGFTRLNPWLGPNVALAHTNKLLDFFAGVDAKLGRGASFRGKLAYQQFRNLPVFVNGFTDSARFELLYDRGSTAVVNPSLEVVLSPFTNLSFNLRGDYFAYSMGQLAKPWHLPAYTASLLTRYTIQNKLTLGLNLHTRGDVVALNPNTLEEVTLPVLTDLDVKVEYLFTPRFGAFVELDNVLNQKVPLYYNYPTRGFLVLAGLSFSF